MKNILVALLVMVFLLSCKSKSNSEIVTEFINAYNKKDSIKTFSLLHPNFTELWKKQTVIKDKASYSNNFSWGKIMNDKEQIEIIKSDSIFVETMSTYYCDRDSLLKIIPYKSKRTYTILDNKIVKITGNDFEGYDNYNKKRMDKYELFFCWLNLKHKLGPNDLPFNTQGANKMKELIHEYNQSDSTFYQIIGDEFKNYKRKIVLKRDFYKSFLDWMFKNHQLKIADLKNTKEDINKLKNYITEFKNSNL